MQINTFILCVGKDRQLQWRLHFSAVCTKNATIFVAENHSFSSRKSVFSTCRCACEKNIIFHEFSFQKHDLHLSWCKTTEKKSMNFNSKCSCFSEKKLISVYLSAPKKTVFSAVFTHVFIATRDLRVSFGTENHEYASNLHPKSNENHEKYLFSI